VGLQEITRSIDCPGGPSSRSFVGHSQRQVEEPVVGLEQVVGFAVLVVEFLLLGLAAVGLALNKLWDFWLLLWDIWL
jgi:hypothetical protein